jgi:hypothetical protein
MPPLAEFLDESLEFSGLFRIQDGANPLAALFQNPVYLPERFRADIAQFLPGRPEDGGDFRPLGFGKIELPGEESEDARLPFLRASSPTPAPKAQVGPIQKHPASHPEQEHADQRPKGLPLHSSVAPAHWFRTASGSIRLMKGKSDS